MERDISNQKDIVVVAVLMAEDRVALDGRRAVQSFLASFSCFTHVLFCRSAQI